MSSSRSFGETFVSEAVGSHDATIVMMHGLGDTGMGWQPVGAMMRVPGLKWLFPTAPTRPITLNGGMPMPGWFDIKSLSVEALMDMDQAGIKEAVDHVLGLVKAEVASGIPPNRIFLGGFSQGGHVAIKAALQTDLQLAGCICLSTWCEPPSAIPGFDEERSRSLKLFIGHGDSDPVVPYLAGKMTHEAIKNVKGVDVRFVPYVNMGHSSCPQEMDDVKDFISECLSAGAEKVTAEQIKAMKVSELKKLCRERGVNTQGCLEKADLVDRCLEKLT